MIFSDYYLLLERPKNPSSSHLPNLCAAPSVISSGLTMVSTGLGLTAALSLLSRARGAILLASHYTGEIHTLSLSTDGADASFAVTSSVSGCGTLPAWLQWDADTETLYCVDESWYGSGMAATFSAGPDGTLTQTTQAITSGASVHSTLFGGEDGKGFLATTE